MKILKYFVFLIIALFLLLVNVKRLPDYYANNIFKVIDIIFPIGFSSHLKLIAYNARNSKTILNDYNEKFLPDTQFNIIDYKKIRLNFIKESDVRYINILKRKPFYIDFFNDYLIVTPRNGTFFYQNIDDIQKKINFKEILSNLKTNYVLDTFIKNQTIYVSFVTNKDDCKFLNLAKAEINLEKLNFKNIFSSKECATIVQGGRIQYYNKNNNTYILFSAYGNLKDNLSSNEEEHFAQDDNSIYGKIISVNEKDNSFKILSKGHRNILGLYVGQDYILSTENGPRGGDEINRIYENKNYGWDIASYGKKYRSDEAYKDHKSLGFEEPIFSFIPSIGISEIVKIDNNFDDDWKDNYIIGSLNYKHLLRVKFDNNFTKLEYYEKIFIGERMRDIKFFKKKSMIFIALEDSGSLGILIDKKSIN